MEIEEVWAKIKGFEEYEVSTLGRVRSLRTNTRAKGEALYQFPMAGYPSVKLWKDGFYKKKLVHRAVIETFNPSDNKKLICLHEDDNRSNNRLSNLRWGTHKENHADAVRNGKHGKHTYKSGKRLEPAQILTLIESKESARKLAIKYGISYQRVYQIRKFKFKKQWQRCLDFKELYLTEKSKRIELEKIINGQSKLILKLKNPNN